MMLDEDEWTDRNFGSPFQKSDVTGADGTKNKDTDEDSVSDLETDSENEDDRDGAKGGVGPESRPLTADETRRLQRAWIKKYDPGTSDDDDEEEESQYDNVRRAR